MKTAPFHPNHFGLYDVYNGGNKVYITGGEISHVEPASALAGQFKSPRASIDSRLAADPILHRKLGVKKVA